MSWSTFVYISWYLVLRGVPASITGANSALTSVTHGFYALSLYRKLRTEEMPLATDPAHSHARTICEEIIGNNEIFTSLSLIPADVEEIRSKHYLPKYADIFPRIFSRVPSSTAQDNYVYTNPYRLCEYKDAFSEQVEFRVSGLRRLKDYFFVCPVEDVYFKVIMPYYVSKEYNVSSFAAKHKPGRFVFGQVIYHPGAFYHAMLAEEPAIAHTEMGFDVEAQFLRIRTHVGQARSNDIDPFCKLVSQIQFHPENQHHRLCVAVARSSHFRDKVLALPDRIPYACTEEEVSFRRMSGQTESRGVTRRRSFYERMTLCHFPRDWPRREEEIYLYISRAYRSNQIFVYLRDPVDGKIYLENLSTNVDILDELNTFDFVED